MGRKLCFLSIFALIVSVPAYASNRYYADNQLEPTPGFAWDWSLGAGYYIEDSYLTGLDAYDDGIEPDLQLTMNYDRFYLDIDRSQLSGNLIVGFSLVDKFDWGVDLIATNTQAGFDETGLKIYNNKVIPELAGVRKRRFDMDAGLRLSRRFDESQLSFELLQDVSGSHNGLIANAFASHIIPWHNWELRAGGGVSIFSSDFTDYYFGIRGDEARTDRPVYHPGSGYSLIVEFHAEYPLSKDWVFYMGWMSTWFSQAISDSPIVSQSYQHKAKVGMRYVF